MSSPRIVAVFGATGLQGAAIVNALLKDQTFVPRAISRHPESATSKNLQARGVEVVKGDTLDKSSLASALQGCEAVTQPVFFFPNMEGKDEIVQGTNIVDAAKEAGIKFFIFSSLPSIAKSSNNKYKNVVQCEGNKFSRRQPQATMPGYKAADRQSFMWVARDVPAAALALLKNYTDPSKQINGKAYPVVSATLSLGELGAKTAKALGTEVKVVNAPPVGMVELDEMFAAHVEYSGMYTATPIPNPELVELFLDAEVRPRFERSKTRKERELDADQKSTIDMFRWEGSHVEILSSIHDLRSLAATGSLLGQIDGKARKSAHHRNYVSSTEGHDSGGMRGTQFAFHVPSKALKRKCEVAPKRRGWIRVSKNAVDPAQLRKMLPIRGAVVPGEAYLAGGDKNGKCQRVDQGPYCGEGDNGRTQLVWKGPDTESGFRHRKTERHGAEGGEVREIKGDREA
ncbi:hypothetical protein DFH06DRAFT_1122092 [Mycena polygramma]|nr:hypothetical protein DFH06DRAFT_1122092 [Mycena polygramma]